MARTISSSQMQNARIRLISLKFHQFYSFLFSYAENAASGIYYKQGASQGWKKNAKGIKEAINTNNIAQVHHNLTVWEEIYKLI